MAKISVTDVLVPAVWEQYFIERTAEMAKFAESGIIGRSAEFDTLAAGPSKVVDMPFWQDITGARQIISDAADFDTNKIGATEDKARIHNDGNAWSANLLAKLLAGSDGMMAIKNLVGDYWARIDEAMLISSVKGVLAAFDALSGDPNYLKIGAEAYADVAAETTLNGETFIDAKQKLGDAKGRLTAIAMHSAVEADLLKQDLITFLPDSEGKPSLPTFQNARVIVDDNMPARDGTTNSTLKVYTSVLFGEGAFARGFSPMTDPAEGGFGTEGVELARSALGHDTLLINRRRHILHPRGVKWNDVSIAAHGGPSDAELEEAQQWTRVFESKNVRIVGIAHNIASAIGGSS